MKTIKIFALPSHQTKERTSGVDFARVIQPMKHLDGYVHGKYKFKVDLYDIFKQEETNWIDVGEKYDMVFFNYTVLDYAYAAMGALVRGRSGKKLIMDMDDALWHVNPDNIAHDALKKAGGGRIITAIIKDVDAITTTNRYLRNVIHHKTGVGHDVIGVFPNMVDLKYYKYKATPQERMQVTLFYYGSTSHFHDLMREDFVGGIDKVFADYPNVSLKVIGANIPKLKLKWGERYTYGWGHSDIYKWISDKFSGFMKEADIMVVPLEDNLYNRCKSDIKFIETATARVPGVYSRVRPYEEFIEDGKTAYLADTPDEWYEKIKILIDSVEKRREIGQNAYDYVYRERQIQKIIPDYAEFIIKHLDK